MKTQKIFLFFTMMVLISSFGFSKTQASEIRIKGQSSASTGPSRVPAAPVVEATQSDNHISLFFLNNVGNVTITIISDTGETEYQNTVSTGYGTGEVIDISDFVPGFYTITFTSNNGLFLQGEFEI